MNVLLLNTYAHGGAAVACRRLHRALEESGTSVNMLTASETGSKWPFYAERLSFLPFEKDASVRFSFSLANFGHDLRRHPLVQSADVLHLHWINQGFLSLQQIQALGALGKPMVWTLHDMWAFTGGCHYSRGCTHYVQHCGNCPYLRRPGPHDLSNRIWERKQRLFPKNLHFVTCSEWLRDVALKSALLQPYSVRAIPNPIDTTQFKPSSAEERTSYRTGLGVQPGAHLLLFSAMKVSETRKGFRYLQEALQILHEQHPGFSLELLVLGKADPSEFGDIPYKIHFLGLVQDQAGLVHAYANADLFAIPSLEDNLPNTVMESLACGTPVVGFNTGGIPEMVGHLQEGFITQQFDSHGLAEGVLQILSGSIKPLEQFRLAAREKVEKTYSNRMVAERYNALYAELL